MKMQVVIYFLSLMHKALWKVGIAGHFYSELWMLKSRSWVFGELRISHFYLISPSTFVKCNTWNNKLLIHIIPQERTHNTLLIIVIIIIFSWRTHTRSQQTQEEKDASNTWRTCYPHQHNEELYEVAPALWKVPFESTFAAVAARVPDVSRMTAVEGGVVVGERPMSKGSFTTVCFRAFGRQGR